MSLPPEPHAPETHVLDELAKVDAQPDTATRARHMAAALEVFNSMAAAQPATQAATDTAEKNSPTRQGFLQRLRLTRTTNHQNGKDAMKPATTTTAATTTATPGKRTRLWQNPALLSGIAASSLAVIAGIGLLQPPYSTHTLESDAVEEVMASAITANVKAAQQQAVQVRREIAEAQMTAKTLRAAPAPSLMADLAIAPPDAPQASTKASTQGYRDRFSSNPDNPVIATRDNPFSTFSIDVDTASYSYTRRLLNQGLLPAKDAVRIEEMVNYFDYQYPQPKSAAQAFTTSVTLLDSPWHASTGGDAKPGNKLLHIAIQGYQLAASDIPQSNLVFLLDVSGSMNEPSKLPLVKQSMELLLSSLKPEDTVAMVVYAGAAGTVLEPTPVKEKQKILAALNNLQAGGSTAGGEGLALAYQLAEANFNTKGVNRIILATDGDFNVGQSDDEALQDVVERKREKGIYLSVLGFGQGNYQDALMQTLAQHGNGTATYIDTLSEAQKVLVEEASSQLFPIAEDMKIQVEFNPATVAEYRLLGYETRALAREDFANDKVDAGEVGAGQRVTAIYEITPVGASSGLLEPGRYQTLASTSVNLADEYGLLRLRYKRPGEAQTQLIEQPIAATHQMSNQAPSLQQQEAQFAVAVAGFAQRLKGSKYLGDFSYDQIIELAQANKGADPYGYRSEFIQLVRKAKMAKPL